MLTLDTQQLERQRRQTRSLEQRERGRQLMRQEIANKEFTTANDGEISTTSLMSQLGTPISSAEFIKKLQKMNRNLVFEVAKANPELMGIYVIENRQRLDGTWGPDKRFVTGMMRGFMPERSVRHVKTSRVPDPDIVGHFREVPEIQKETRGWRTVLKNLLKQRLITQGQIDRYFPVNLDSKNWQALTT